jgi:hypothetical protein
MEPEGSLAHSQELSTCPYLTFFIFAFSILVVKALGYKPEGREFDTRWGDFFKLT